MAETLGQRIRRLRSERRVQLGELADCVGLSPGGLANIEHDRAVPNLRNLYRIADAFGLTASFLLRGIQVDRYPPNGKRRPRSADNAPATSGA